MEPSGAGFDHRAGAAGPPGQVGRPDSGHRERATGTGVDGQFPGPKRLSDWGRPGGTQISGPRRVIRTACLPGGVAVS